MLPRRPLAGPLTSLLLLVLSLGAATATPACVGSDPDLAGPADGDGGPLGPDGVDGVAPTPGSGGRCERDDQCESAFCADGFCCDKACDGQCEACNEPGKEGQCVAVSGSPRGDRGACDGAGDTVCGGSCDGKKRSECMYPEDECRAGACTAGVATTAAKCDRGVCPASTAVQCSASANAKYCGPTSCIGVTQVVAGYDFTCALMSDTTVRCWGAGYAGQLGQGPADLKEHATPVTVKGLTGVVKLTAAPGYSGRVCALLSDQTATCWGSGAYGALGNGSVVDRIATPSPVLKAAGMPLTAIKDISAGQFVTCALDATGAAWCWGLQLQGAVGDGVEANTSRLYPAAVVNSGTGNSSIWAGYDQVCMTTTAGNTASVKCWGYNGSYFSLGQPAGMKFSSATLIPSFSIANGGLAQPVVVGGDGGTGCVITQTSTLSCWGANDSQQLGRNGAATPSATPSNVCRTATTPCTSPDDVMRQVTSFGIGEAHSCAVSTLAGVGVRCWGRGNYGALGDGNVALHTVANAGVGPTLTPAATQIAVGAYHACALLTDRSVRCWGWNSDGQLGNGLAVDSAVPVAPLL